MIIANQTAILQDPVYFPEPEKFFPGRFIDGNGAVVKNEALIPFSVGKMHFLDKSVWRSDLGESSYFV